MKSRECSPVSGSAIARDRSRRPGVRWGVCGEPLDGSALRGVALSGRGCGWTPASAVPSDDLRHTFGSVAIRTADPRELQEWMGHSDFSTTQIYMHYKPRADAARRLSAAFHVPTEEDAVRTNG